MEESPATNSTVVPFSTQNDGGNEEKKKVKNRKVLIQVG